MTASPAWLRRDLVRDLKGRGAIRTELVESAFEAVPRELFVPEVAAERGLEALRLVQEWGERGRSAVRLDVGS